MVFESNRDLPESYFEHLEFDVNDFWFDYFRKKLKWAEVSPNGIVLDVCAGTGTMCLNLMKRSYFDNCVAIDISEPAINRLNERIKENSLNGKVEAMCDNIMNTRFNDSEFDYIIGNSFLHHLPDNKSFLEEMLRVLKGNRRICLTGEPTTSAYLIEGLFVNNILKFINNILNRRKSSSQAVSDIWLYNRITLIQLFESVGFREVRLKHFGFTTSLFNEISLILFKLFTGKSMQPYWYWRVFGFIDSYLFFWLPSCFFTHFTVTAKK